MNEKNLEEIQKVLILWQSKRRFTYEQKQVTPILSPISKELSAYNFKISVHSFFCNNELIPLENQETFVVNPPLEAKELDEFLKNFEIQFYKMAEEKITNCEGLSTTSDQLFFK